MGMPDLLDSWTRDQVLALPDDGNGYELVDGILLVTPTPRALHQIAVWALSRASSASRGLSGFRFRISTEPRTQTGLGMNNRP